MRTRIIKDMTIEDVENFLKRDYENAKETYNHSAAVYDFTSTEENRIEMERAGAEWSHMGWLCYELGIEVDF